MYSDRLAVAIKVNGKVLREFKDTVYIPFGSEYSILVKNVHSLRCMVRVSVDGQDATEGVSLIVPANSSVELERFIKGGNLNEGNRFKFIERSAKIEEHRGVGVEDGLVRVEYEFEREPVPVKTPDWGWPYRTYIQQDVWLYNQPQPTWTVTSSGTGGGTVSANSVNLSDTSKSARSYSDKGGSYADQDGMYRFTGAEGNVTMDCADIPVNDAGITVPGSVSGQTFNLTSGFLTDGVKHVMVLKLLGQAGEKPVQQAVTVKTTQKCSTCGVVNKATNRFCIECGTSLTIV